MPIRWKNFSTETNISKSKMGQSVRGDSRNDPLADIFSISLKAAVYQSE